jgi:hypothetical protein
LQHLAAKADCLHWRGVKLDHLGALFANAAMTNAWRSFACLDGDARVRSQHFSETVIKNTLSGSFGPRRPADGNGLVAKEISSSTVQSTASFP